MIFHSECCASTYEAVIPVGWITLLIMKRLKTRTGIPYQRRAYTATMYNRKVASQKMDCMHHNPVKAGSVKTRSNRYILPIAIMSSMKTHRGFSRTMRTIYEHRWSSAWFAMRWLVDDNTDQGQDTRYKVSNC